MGCRKTLYILCLLLALVFSSFCFPLSASAFDYTSNLRYIRRLRNGSVYYSDSNQPNNWRQGWSSYAGINSYDGSRWFRLSNSDRSFITTGQQIVVISGQFYASSYAGGVINTSGMMGIGVDAMDCSIVQIDSDTVTMDNVMADELITYRKNFTITCEVVSGRSDYISVNLHLYSGGQESVSSYGINFTNVYVFDRDKTNSDLHTDLKDIYNYMNNTLGGKLDGIKNSQDQANEDANDRYQDEKDTINDAANDAESDASSQNFNFNIPNPLQSWFGGFSDSDCANIPNLAVWLHSNETRICTPWPSSVRTVMTTIVTGLCMLLLFTFIINWVKKNDTGGN